MIFTLLLFACKKRPELYEKALKRQQIENVQATYTIKGLLPNKEVSSFFKFEKFQNFHMKTFSPPELIGFELAIKENDYFINLPFFNINLKFSNFLNMNREKYFKNFINRLDYNYDYFSFKETQSSKKNIKNFRYFKKKSDNLIHSGSVGHYFDYFLPINKYFVFNKDRIIMTKFDKLRVNYKDFYVPSSSINFSQMTYEFNNWSCNKSSLHKKLIDNFLNKNDSFNFNGISCDDNDNFLSILFENSSSYFIFTEIEKRMLKINYKNFIPTTFSKKGIFIPLELVNMNIFMFVLGEKFYLFTSNLSSEAFLRIVEKY